MRRIVRRLIDALLALVTWAAAATAVLWFYDWLSRWYVVVAVLLGIVVVAIMADRLKARDAAVTAGVEALPTQRAPETVDASWPATAEQVA